MEDSLQTAETLPLSLTKDTNKDFGLNILFHQLV